MVKNIQNLKSRSKEVLVILTGDQLLYAENTHQIYKCWKILQTQKKNHFTYIGSYHYLWFSLTKYIIPVPTILIREFKNPVVEMLEYCKTYRYPYTFDVHAYFVYKIQVLYDQRQEIVLMVKIINKPTYKICGSYFSQ